MKVKSLAGKVIIITGASGGIGGAASDYLFERGANIVRADIKITNTKLTNVCEGENIKRMLEHPLNVKEADDWEKLYNNVIEEFGKTDVLINCSGILESGDLTEQSVSQIEEQLNINLLGPILGSKIFLPLFKNQNNGHIINIASLAGLTPIPYETIYSASKFGIRGFTLALANELSNTGVKATVICPDSVITDMLIKEAQHEKANLSFTGKLLDTQYIAGKIYESILRPKTEVLITYKRGVLSKLGGDLPFLLRALMPLLNKIGARNRIEFLGKIQNNIY